MARWLPSPRSRACRPVRNRKRPRRRPAAAARRAGRRAGRRQGADQGRHPAFAVGHDGDQRDVAEGRRADDDRRDQRQGRRAWARSSSRWSSTRPRTGRCSPRRRASCITQDKVAVVFGCWTSVSRKSVLPVFEELNGLLFYPVQYEGEELVEERVLHRRRAQPAGDPGGRVPDEQGRRRRQALGPARHRLRLPAHHQQDPARVPQVQGRRRQGHQEEYTPFGHSDYQTIVADIKKFSAGGKTAVVSTINGDSNVPFYKELGNQGLKATDVPVVAFSVGEEELRGVDTKPLVGHLAAWNYFMSIEEPGQRRVHRRSGRPTPRRRTCRARDKPLTNDPMEATYIGIHMWKQAVEKAKTHRHRQGDRRRWPARPSRRRRASHRRWTRRTTTCTSRCSSARSRPTASSTWCGRPKGPVKAQPWSPFIPDNDEEGRAGLDLPVSVRQLHRAEVRRGRAALAARSMARRASRRCAIARDDSVPSGDASASLPLCAVRCAARRAALDRRGASARRRRRRTTRVEAIVRKLARARRSARRCRRCRRCCDDALQVGADGASVIGSKTASAPTR